MIEQKKQFQVKEGYERLAFGGVGDAIQLLFSDEEDLAQLRELDLFNVSEIRRPKGGGIEIKFFDRIKALQCLEQISGSNTASPLYRALEEGARALRDRDHEV